MIDNMIEKEIKKSLFVLELPVLISLKDLKKRYRQMSKKYHPDIYKDKDTMYKINEAYKILLHYIENYKFKFSTEEILYQYPQESYAKKFKF